MSLTEFNGQLLNGLEFCGKVYALFEHIRSSDDGKSRLRMRKTVVEKRLIEELFPICRYVQTNYRAGRYISVRWLSGNQKFDAELHQSGAYVDLGQYPAAAHLEVTRVVHGNEYLSRELLDSGGVAFGVEGIARDKKTRAIKSAPIVRTNGDFIDAFCPLLLAGIAKKAVNGYPAGTTLIVGCTLNTLYTPDEWDKLLEKARAELPQHTFREIFVYDELTGRSHTFFSPAAA